MKRSRFLVLFVLLLAGGLLANTWQYLGEAKVERNELKNFPRQVGRWEQSGADKVLDSQTLGVLRATDYVLRDYKTADGRVFGFYVGYYASQREGATYHSPLNCLPGSGWVMSEPGTVTIQPEGRPAFVANRYVIENGGHRDLLLYWYQGRGRAVASEYWGKVYTVVDSVRLRRSDGALVRITTPVGKSESDALRAATEMATQVAIKLPEFIPD